jgi:hypothetical protein
MKSLLPYADHLLSFKGDFLVPSIFSADYKQLDPFAVRRLFSTCTSKVCLTTCLFIRSQPLMDHDGYLVDLAEPFAP